jgi:hypothetical protein
MLAQRDGWKGVRGISVIIYRVGDRRGKASIRRERGKEGERFMCEGVIGMRSHFSCGLS